MSLSQYWVLLLSILLLFTLLQIGLAVLLPETSLTNVIETVIGIPALLVALFVIYRASVMRLRDLGYTDRDYWQRFVPLAGLKISFEMFLKSAPPRTRIIEDL
jgi:uncharacterized membrane protein YhaH (DUF805 family)